MTADIPFQRAPQAPPLPVTPFRFILYFVAKLRWWYAATALFEIINAGSGIMIPYATSRIIKGVVASGAHSDALLATLRTPFLLFLGFSVAEVLFGRAGGARMSPVTCTNTCNIIPIVISAIISPGRWRIASAKPQRAWRKRCHR